MESNYKDRREKSFAAMRMVYNLAMSILILGVGVVIFFGGKWGIIAIKELDPLMKNLFGGLCLLYGGFRLYRSFKRED